MVRERRDNPSSVDGRDVGGMHGPRPLSALIKWLAPSRRATQEDVAEPQLVGARAFWDSSVATGLTPDRLAQVLRGAVRGDIRDYLTLAEEIEERDLHYAGVLGVRKRAIAGIAPSVEPVSEKRADRKVADFVRGLIETPEFVDLVEDMMDAVAKGFSATEIGWGEQDGLWKPLAYTHRDPKYFTFDYVSRTELRLSELGTIDGLPLPPAKFIVHTPRTKTGLPIRAGLARTVAWGFLFKSFSLKNWGSFLDVFGMPFRVGKYHPNATEEERRKLLRAVVGIASDAAAIIPESMMIEFVEAKANSLPTYENMCRFVDEQVSKIVLGQTMSTDNGSSRAQALVHNEVRMDIVEWDGRQLARTLNAQLIRPAVAFNFGADVACPRIEFLMPKREDIKVKSEAIGLLVQQGLEVSQDDARELIGVPAPKEGAKLLTPQAAAPPPQMERSDAPPPARPKLRAVAGAAGHVPGCRCGGCLRLATAAEAQPAPIDAIDAIGLDEAAEWAPQLGPMVEAILRETQAATSYEDLRARLDRLVATLDVSVLQGRLLVAGLKARGLGEATDDV